ncbi:MAG: ribonuclease HII [Acidobacteriota bacterium]
MKCGTKLEKQLLAEGYRLIAGVDEVGRGALAGPVVAASVILNLKDVPKGINDSKQLSKARRERLAEEIKSRAVAFSIARVEPDEIDKINILRASLQAMGESVKLLNPPSDYVLIDGNQRISQLSCPQRPVVKGDSLCVSIAAASIIAKVARDELMRTYEEIYPGYGFAAHVGYGTRLHQQALTKLGPSPIHRMTFQGVRFLQLCLTIEE